MRKRIITLLENMGFEPIAFELDSMRVEPNVHSHKACLLAVDLSEIIILVIDKRYGGLYLGRDSYSITERELLKAYQLKKPIIACISRRTFDARKKSFNKLKKYAKKMRMDEDEAKKKVKPIYVDKWEVLEFVSSVCRLERDQYLIIYNSTEQLLKSIKGRLEGLSRYILSMLVERQIQFLDSSKTASGLFSSIGASGNHDVFIEPPYRMISGQTRRRSAFRVVETLKEYDTRILLTGDPGLGKTTLLGHAFKKHARFTLKEKKYRLPFYLNLRGYGFHYHFDFNLYLEECFYRYLLKETYPCLKLNDIKPVFYIDGLDETSHLPVLNDFEKINRYDIFKFPFLLSTRLSFARKNIDQSLEMGSLIRIHINLEKWSKNESQKLIQQHLSDTKKPLRVKIKNFLNSIDDNNPIIQVPLLLALLILIARTDNTVPYKNIEIAEMYEWFLERWSKREIYRHGISSSDKKEELYNILLKAWETSAWHIYQSRFRGENIEESDLRQILRQDFNSYKNLILSNAFSNFFSYSYKYQITGMLHEQFFEFFVAKSFITKCISNSPDITDYLKNPISFQINTFIKQLWAKMNSNKLSLILETLNYFLTKNLKNSDFQSVNISVNCIYYISRVPLRNEAINILESALPEVDNLFVKHAILFALVRLGIKNREEELYHELTSNQEADEINRGLHLIYFKDINILNSNYNYSDDNKSNWQYTLDGMMNHIANNEPRFLYSRRLDIYIIRSYIASRGQLGPFTIKHLEKIRESIELIKNRKLVNEVVLNKIVLEFLKLGELFNSVK